MQEIVLLGAGGQAKDMIKNIEEYNSDRSKNKRLKVLGCLDDTPGAAKEVAGYPVLDSMKVFEKKGLKSARVICAVGDPVNKRAFIRKAAGYKLKFFNIIHPSVNIHRSCRLGTGISIFANSVISAFCDIGDHTAINYLCSINHDCSVGSLATLGPGVNIGGTCVIGEAAFLGINSCTINDIEVGPWSVIGAGTTVIGDVKPYTIVVGNPHKAIGRRDSRAPII